MTSTGLVISTGLVTSAGSAGASSRALTALSSSPHCSSEEREGLVKAGLADTKSEVVSVKTYWLMIGKKEIIHIGFI